MTEPNTYLKVSQVASELNVTTQAVYVWIAEGKIDAIQLAGNKKGAIRVARAALDAFIEASKVKACQVSAQAVGQ